MPQIRVASSWYAPSEWTVQSTLISKAKEFARLAFRVSPSSLQTTSETLALYSNHSTLAMSAPTISFTTSSPAPSTSSAESIQPMHVAPQAQAQLPHGNGVPEAGHAAMTLGAKGFLAKKMAASG